MALELTGKQQQALAEALGHAFGDYDSLNLLTKYELDIPLSDVVQRDRMPVVTQALVVWAIQCNRVEDLVGGALAQRPRNPRLLQFKRDLEAASAAPPDPEPPARTAELPAAATPGPGTAQSPAVAPKPDPAPALKGMYERQFHPDARTKDALAARAEQEAAERRVCRLDKRTGPGTFQAVGTGFLVAKDLVLTANHVVEGLSAEGRAVFDFTSGRASADDARCVAFGGGEKWVVHRSPTRDLDYAILELAEAAGEDVLEGPSRTRGWLPVRTAPVPDGTTITLLQHPNGRKLEISRSGVTTNLSRTHVHYLAATESGSSGSPVMTIDWEVIAVHHYADTPNGMNRGTRMDAILDNLPADILRRLGGAEPPPVAQQTASRPPPTAAESPRGPAGKGHLESIEPAADLPGAEAPSAAADAAGRTGSDDRSAASGAEETWISAEKRGDMKKIYLSYTPADQEFCDALKAHLAGLVQNFGVELEDHTNVPPAGDREAARMQMLDAADMVVTLLSARSLAAAPTAADLAHALATKSKRPVVPVLLRPMKLENTKLKGLVYLPREGPHGPRPIGQPGNDALWVEVVEEITAMLFPGRQA